MFKYTAETTASIRNDIAASRAELVETLTSPLAPTAMSLVNRTHRIAKMEGALRVTEIVDVMKADGDDSMTIIARLAEIAAADSDDDIVRTGSMAQASAMIAQFATQVAVAV